MNKEELIEQMVMRNKLCYYSANIALISAMPVVLFFVLAGVEVAFELRTIWGFVFMIVGCGYVMACGISMAMHIKHNFQDEKVILWTKNKFEGAPPEGFSSWSSFLGYCDDIKIYSRMEIKAYPSPPKENS